MFNFYTFINNYKSACNTTHDHTEMPTDHYTALTILSELLNGAEHKLKK